MMKQEREYQLSQEEKSRILFEFNRTEVEYPKDKTLHRLFEEQVERTPEKIAVIGVQHLSFKELNQKADQLALLLREKGVGPDTLAAIMVEPSIEMVIGILGILKAGGAYLPVDRGFPPERINYMLKDSNARVFLKKSEINSLEFRASTFKVGKVEPSNLAYIIYTSGSTGKPKGVMVEHGSVVNVLSALFNMYPMRETDAYLLKTSFLFDVSVTELFGWYWGGGRLVIMEEEERKDPWRIIDVIELERITHINFAPSLFNVFLEVLDERNIVRISGLKYIFLAGEELLPEVVSKFRRFDTDIVLENLYGPTEGTIYASAYSLGQWDGTGKVPIGKPLRNVKLYILDSHHRLESIGVSGELCIGGAAVARGYLNNPELTAEKFVCCRSYRPYGTYFSKKTYRTGDLARWLPDGNIEFLGRMDHQVQIRGVRVELGEIENQLLTHPGIKEAGVLFKGSKGGSGDSGDGYLCAYVVSDNELKVPGLRKYLAALLPGYMIPSYFVVLEKMPLTPTGKIDRRALPEPGFLTPEGKQNRNDYTAPRDELEMELAGIWSRVLGIEKNSIGVENNFFELGGHSLRATLMIAEMRKRFNVCLYLSEFFDIPTIRGLGAYVEKAAKHGFVPIKLVEKKEYYPLSPAQKRFYFVYRLDSRSTAYNVYEAFILERKADKQRMENTFKKLIERHESLRTSFEVVDNDPVQTIHDRVDFAMEYDDSFGRNWHYSTSAGNLDGIIQEFVRPFELSVPPLFRAGLIGIEKEKHLFLFDMHHIITDGISVEIFIKEFMTIYEGEEEKLPELELQYKDFSQWQNRLMDSEEMKRQEAYWLKEFSSGVPVLDVPTDYERPENQDFEGTYTRFEISPGQIMSLREYAGAEGTTMFTVLLAVFYILLSKLSGSDDIVVGTPVAARRHSDLYRIIGAFINTLALRNYPGQDKSFAEFLKEVKQRTLDAFDNQDYQFEDLVKNVYIKRHSGRNPIFDVMFTFIPRSQDAFWIQGKTRKKKDAFAGFKKYEGQDLQTMLDLILSVVETDRSSKLFFNFKYCTRLFKKETIEKYITYFKEIVSAVVENKHITLKEIKISHDLGSAKTEVPRITFGF